MSGFYNTGARGFIVQYFQAGLGVAADGVFGKQTALAVRELQRRIGFPVTGAAGEQEFMAVGVKWPSEFERAINLVSNFEGTSFGDCNATDIDGAGLTLGIAGFTTLHGEVQQLLAKFLSQRDHAAECLPVNTRIALMESLAKKPSAAAWKQLFYGAHGVVRREWRLAFKHWGKDQLMQQLQLQMAHDKFWQPAVDVVRSLEFITSRARLFMFDVAVQNGGWRRSHLMLAKRMVDWHSGNEQKALVVAARAVAACAKEKWRNDVLARKMAIATGAGVVHGRQWKLSAHAILISTD